MRVKKSWYYIVYDPISYLGVQALIIHGRRRYGSHGYVKLQNFDVKDAVRTVTDKDDALSEKVVPDNDDKLRYC